MEGGTIQRRAESVNFNERKLNELTGQIIDACYRVHRELGPGLLESVYERCLAYELECRGINYQRQTTLPLQYRGLQIDDGLRLDLLVQGKVIVELKSVQRLERIHEAQVLTYLKISQVPLGILINFNSRWLRDGIRRLAGPSLKR